MDEIQYTKGHKHLTLVYQIDQVFTRLLWVAKERTIKSSQGLESQKFCLRDQLRYNLQTFRILELALYHSLANYLSLMNSSDDSIKKGQTGHDCRPRVDTPVLRPNTPPVFNVLLTFIF